MKTRFVLLTFLVLLIIGATGYFLFAVPEQPEPQDRYLAEVKLRDLEVQVRTLGTLEAKDSYMISSQIKGTGAKIIYLAPNGTFVAKDEILVRLDPKPFEDAAAELSGQVESLTAAVSAAEQLLEWEKTEAEQRVITTRYKHRVAQLDLKRLVEGEGPLKLAQFKDELDKTELELKHHQAYEADLNRLEREGVTNPAELDRVREDIKALRETFKSAKRQYDSYRDYVLPVMVESAREKEKNTALSIEQTKQSGVHKIANAQATLDQTRGKLKAAEQALQKAGTELDKTVIRAPFDGLIVHYETYRNGELRLPREGDNVIINQPIMYFPDISSLVIKSRIREVDLRWLQVRQKASIIVDAYPDRSYSGELLFIGSLAKKDNEATAGEKYFQVVFSLSGEDERLRPGMSARIVVHIAEKKMVPVVPIQSVFRDEGGAFCYLWNGVMYEKRYITPGLRNEDYVEVVKGLQPGVTVSRIQPQLGAEKR